MKLRTAQILSLGLIVLAQLNPMHDSAFAQSSSFTPTPGPDVIVSKIPNTTNYTCTPNPCLDPIDGTAIDAIAVGTISCNIGTEPLQWEQYFPEHPVIRTGAFRFLNGRFEQIGTSWVKHGFFATNETSDCFGTCSNSEGGYQLNPGCSDLYTSSLNGSWTLIGPASVVNAFTGVNPGAPLNGYPGNINRPVDARLQIHYSDLDPALNPGALYFLQAHYVTADDAAAGNAENNASYRRVTVTGSGSGYDISITSSTRQQEPAINAWQEFDPAVVQVNARVPAEGLFIVSARATDVGGTFWHYEYAIENLNSDRSGSSFTIPLPQHAIVQNIGFHDVDYHSGEPYSRDNWTATIQNDQITWSCVPYNLNPDANALRWSTLYNFRFDVNAPPEVTTATLGLFKPGAPDSINLQTIGPTLEMSDCNHNGAEDLCDIDCNSLPFCVQPCGFSNDCNHNSVPDECEPDCNHNGITDECDIRDCPPDDLACADCNGNGVPDECEPDCDGDGIPDTCELVLDSDGDGVDDCNDACPFTTPEGACDPPITVTCRFASGLCVSNFPFSQCASGGGTAVCGDNSLPCNLLAPCITSACRDGCLIGDQDGDGDVDLLDGVGFQECFSGDKDAPDFVAPTPECLTHFDFDNDGDVDSLDAKEVYTRTGGPRQ